jgi:hypothetical protein
MKRAVEMAAGIVAGLCIIKYIEILFLSNDRRHEMRHVMYVKSCAEWKTAETFNVAYLLCHHLIINTWEPLAGFELVLRDRMISDSNM